MRHTPSHLAVAPPTGAAGGRLRAAAGEAGDLGLMATIFAVALLPLACAAAGVGRWGGGTLGLGAVGSLFAGRELWAWAVATVRGRGRS